MFPIFFLRYYATDVDTPSPVFFYCATVLHLNKKKICKPGKEMNWWIDLNWIVFTSILFLLFLLVCRKILCDWATSSKRFYKQRNTRGLNSAMACSNVTFKKTTANYQNFEFLQRRFNCFVWLVSLSLSLSVLSPFMVSLPIFFL